MHSLVQEPANNLLLITIIKRTLERVLVSYPRISAK